jgi:hypothetical protein
VDDPTCWALLGVALALILLGSLLCWLGRRPKPPKLAKPERRHRRMPQEPLHYDHGSPAQRWLYGDYDKKDDNREGK